MKNGTVVREVGGSLSRRESLQAPPPPPGLGVDHLYWALGEASLCVSRKQGRLKEQHGKCFVLQDLQTQLTLLSVSTDTPSI